MKCKRIETYLSSYIDNELPPHLALTIREHIGSCGRCARLFRQYVLLQRDLCELEKYKEPEMSLHEALEAVNKMQLTGVSSQGPLPKNDALKKNEDGFTLPRPSRRAATALRALAATLVAGVVLMLFFIHHDTEQSARQVALNEAAEFQPDSKENNRNTGSDNHAQTEEPHSVHTASATIDTKKSQSAVDAVGHIEEPISVASQPEDEPVEPAVSQKAAVPPDERIPNEPMSKPPVEVAVQETGDSPAVVDIPAAANARAKIPVAESRTEEAVIMLREQFVPAAVASAGTGVPVDYKQVTNEYGDQQFVFASQAPDSTDHLEAVTHINSFKERIVQIISKPNCKAIVVSDKATNSPPYLLVEVPASNYDTCTQALQQLGEVQDIPLIDDDDTADKDSDDNGFVRLRIIYDISKDIQ